MKKINFLVVLLIVAFGFFGCATTSNSTRADRRSGEGRFIEKAGKFSIKIPEAWETAEFPGLQYNVLVGPAEDGFTPNINFADEAFDGPLNTYVDAVIEQLKNLLGENVKVLQRDGFATAKNLQGEKIVINSFQQGRHFQQTIYCFPGNGKKILVTCTASAEADESYAALFDDTAKTFEWIN